ncbi:MAG: hypothetical protein JWR68_829 [Polaromonas sp.]|nr:hypothetical protein [Polaromonas sp.]
MTSQRTSTVRACAFRSIALSLANTWLYRVVVWTVGWQVLRRRAGLLDGNAHASDLVGAQVVHHHDVAGPQFGHEKLPGPGAKGRPVDGAVQHQRRAQSLRAQRADKGRGAPVACGRKAPAALAPGRAAPHRGHARGGPGLVKEDQPSGRQLWLLGAPVLAGLRDVGPRLLGGVQGDFFLASPRTASGS